MSEIDLHLANLLDPNIPINEESLTLVSLDLVYRTRKAYESVLGYDLLPIFLSSDEQQRRTLLKEFEDEIVKRVVSSYTYPTFVFYKDNNDDSTPSNNSFDTIWKAFSAGLGHVVKEVLDFAAERNGMGLWKPYKASQMGSRRISNIIKKKSLEQTINDEISWLSTQIKENQDDMALIDSLPIPEESKSAKIFLGKKVDFLSRKLNKSNKKLIKLKGGTEPKGLLSKIRRIFSI